ncbi:hypothetical protein ACHAQH_001223, partial [Verticillium albo-atrum]
YHAWKLLAKGVAVDEAANMHRGDLACVWGNTLLPCFLGGDPKQLPPAVITGKDTDILGFFLHRLPDDGKISPLEFFQGSGMPVYRLRTQLRMANGLFDMVSREIYPEVPLQYADSCQVALPRFENGRLLEAFLKNKFPDIVSPAAGSLSPFFVHCENSRVFVNEVSGSKRSPDQVKVALDLAVELVTSKGIKAEDLVFLAPYAANVELIERLRKGPSYTALADMPDASTIDGFQGREADIVFVVMSTRGPKPGPGFTTDEQRLNVMLTRQHCGLVIVGDIHVTGRVEKMGKGKGKGKGKAVGERFQVIRSSGEVAWTRATVLANIHLSLYEAGRVGTVLVREKAQ